MAKEIKNNIAAMMSLRGAKRRSNLVLQITLIAAFVLGLAMPAFATYTPPVGNNNDVQYKNGFGFAGSDNFVVNGTNVGIGTTIPQGGFVVMNGNVGIGTWVPGSPLQISAVQYTVPMSVDSTTWNSGNYTGLGFGGSQSGNINIKAAVLFSNSDPVYNSWGRGDLLFAVNNGSNNNSVGSSDERMRITADGNVGIGSTTPGQALDVQGTVRATNFIGNGAGLTGLSSGLWATQNTTDQSLAGGNVGIGTTITNAGAALSVMNGNVGIGTWVPVDQMEMVNAASNTLMIKSLNFGAAPQLTLQGNPGSVDQLIGDILFYTGSSGYNSQIAAYRGSNSADFTYMTFSNANTSTGNLMEYMRLDPNGNLGIGTTTPVGGLTVMNGNVGIGTWVPANLLDISGSNPNHVESDGFGLYFTSTGTAQIKNISGGSNSGMNLIGGTGISSFVQLTATGYGSPNNGYITFNTGIDGGTQAMLINNSGNVGIGTSTTVGGLAVMNGNVGIGTWVPNSGLQMAQSFAVYRTPTATSASSAGQTIIGVTSTAAARTITLATADTVPGRVIIIKDESGAAGTNNITVNTQSGQTIDGASSVSISANYGVLRVYSDGSNWYTF